MALARNSAFLAVLVLVGACAGNASRRAAAPRSPDPRLASERTIDVEPLRIQVVEDGAGTEVEAYDARDLFDRAGAALDGESWDQALELYDRLVREFPGSALIVPALFNAGLAHEGKGDWTGAVGRYEEVARIARPADRIDAWLRVAAVHAEQAAWDRSVEALDRVLASKDASSAARVEAHARRGYALTEKKSYAAAEKSLRAAATLRSGSDKGDWFVAMAQYYLAEIPRRQAEAVPLRLPEKQLRADLEAKATLVLLAQERFEATVGLGNVYWATAAGYQMGSVQEHMWRALLTAPVPSELDANAARVYADEVRKLARPHLERALDVHTRNVRLAERTGTESPWSEGSRQRIGVLADLIAREARGERPGPDEVGGAAAPPATPGDPDRYVPARIDF